MESFLPVLLDDSIEDKTLVLTQDSSHLQLATLQSRKRVLSEMHFTSYDVLFLRDNLGRIAVFTMVSTDSEFGSFYRSDHKGFCYKNAHLYIDTRGYHQMMGAKHYLTTEDLSGKWSLICIYKPQDYVPGAYNEFTARVLIAKNFSSEKGVLDHFKDVLKVCDLRNTERFTFIDVCNPPDNL